MENGKPSAKKVKVDSQESRLDAAPSSSASAECTSPAVDAETLKRLEERPVFDDWHGYGFAYFLERFHSVPGRDKKLYGEMHDFQYCGNRQTIQNCISQAVKDISSKYDRLRRLPPLDLFGKAQHYRHMRYKDKKAKAYKRYIMSIICRHIAPSYRCPADGHIEPASDKETRRKLGELKLKKKWGLPARFLRVFHRRHQRDKAQFGEMHGRKFAGTRAQVDNCLDQARAESRDDWDFAMAFDMGYLFPRIRVPREFAEDYVKYTDYKAACKYMRIVRIKKYRKLRKTNKKNKYSMYKFPRPIFRYQSTSEEFYEHREYVDSASASEDEGASSRSGSVSK